MKKKKPNVTVQKNIQNVLVLVLNWVIDVMHHANVALLVKICSIILNIFFRDDKKMFCQSVFFEMAR
jgi:hypothetical protein